MSEPRSGKQRRILTTEGWHELKGSSEQILFQLEPTHPDYPKALQGKGPDEDFRAFTRDKRVQDALSNIQQRLEGLGQRYEAEIVSGRPLDGVIDPSFLNRAFETFAEQFVQIVIEEEERAGPTKRHRRRLAYLLQEASGFLPKLVGKEVVNVVEKRSESYAAPLQVIANPSPAPVQVSVYPHETAIVFARFQTSDLSSLGPIINQAQELAGQIDQRGTGGRPSNKDDRDKSDQARTAAKLHHWQEWTYPKIAALFGWSGDRKAIEQRVRRAVRLGEDILTNELGPRWKTEPPTALDDEG